MGTDTQRLFFALWPTAGLRAALADLSTALPPETGRRVNPANLHITLLFLGSVTGEQRRAIEAIAKHTIVSPFTLVLDRYGYWRRPQVVWAGSCQPPPPALATLMGQLQHGAIDRGLRVDSRPFEIHLTLYRKVRHPPPTWPALPPLHWPVKDFALVESLSDAQGVRYEVRRSWPLIAGASSTSE